MSACLVEPNNANLADNTKRDNTKRDNTKRVDYLSQLPIELLITIVNADEQVYIGMLVVSKFAHAVK